jgi:hypothetical protein
VRKRQPSPRAFGAASHGPRPRRPAAIADRLCEPDEPVATGVAERDPRGRADGATLGQDELEHAASVPDDESGLRAGSVPISAHPPPPAIGGSAASVFVRPPTSSALSVALRRPAGCSGWYWKGGIDP